MIEDSTSRSSERVYLHTQFPPDEGFCGCTACGYSKTIQSWEFEQDALNDGNMAACCGYALKGRCQVGTRCAIAVPSVSALSLIHFSCFLCVGTCTALSGLYNLICLPTACCCPEQYQSSVNRTISCSKAAFHCIHVSCHQACIIPEDAACCLPLVLAGEPIYACGYAQRVLTLAKEQYEFEETADKNMKEWYPSYS